MNLPGWVEETIAQKKAIPAFGGGYGFREY
jgi:hypothetical protein